MNTQTEQPSRTSGRKVCPWWLAYFFDNPLRRMVHSPGKILGPYVSEGMTVLDFGCGFGHFSLGMARLTGETGQVVAADVQQKMLDKTMARARKAGLERIIRPLLCDGVGVGAPLELDFALASNSLHETPDPAALLAELFTLIKPGGHFLLMEPQGHLKDKDFDAEIALAVKLGFVDRSRPKVTREMCSLLKKPERPANA